MGIKLNTLVRITAGAYAGHCGTVIGSPGRDGWWIVRYEAITGKSIYHTDDLEIETW